LLDKYVLDRLKYDSSLFLDFDSLFVFCYELKFDDVSLSLKKIIKWGIA